MDTFRWNISKANNESESSINVRGPVGVFVGGTSGIGEHSAYAFARHTHQPTVYIVGRNEEAGKRVLNKLNQIQPTGTYELLKHDLTLVSEAQKVAQEIIQRERKINVLSVSCGAYNLNSSATTEAIDSNQALFVYSRWKIIDALLPLVNEAARANEPARVANVLGPLGTGKTTMDDVDTTDTRFDKVAGWSANMANLLTMKYARLYPDVTIMNVFPGFVNTGLYRELPEWVQWPAHAVMRIFLESPGHCGERMHYLNFVKDIQGKHGHLMGVFYDRAPNYIKNGYLDEKVQDKAYDKVQQVFQSL